MPPPSDEHLNYYAPLLEKSPPSRTPLAVIIASVIFVLSLGGLILNNQSPQPFVGPTTMPAASDQQFNWTQAMFTWQRTSYHFQPQKNWMNDPDGPLFHMGWYHLFYQYNPDSAIWGNITWGHAVSRDMISWLYLPEALVPDQWYDINGVWTGSASVLPGGDIMMLYTGDTNGSAQVQCLAYPADLWDPLLLRWVKHPSNPVIVAPPGISSEEFRDPTSAWPSPDGSSWLLAIGSTLNGSGLALLYSTSDFVSFRLLPDVLHSVPGTGEWECLDFYPLPAANTIKHVLKASLDDTKRDVYAIGTYHPNNNTWTPDHPHLDVGLGLEVDYGRYYASKTFYDQNTDRRILWGWVNETDSAGDDLDKGWASLQTIPRVVTFDNKTGANILQWPVEEIESLRLNSTDFTDVDLAPGSVLPLHIGNATQLDIVAEFEYQLIQSNETQVVSIGCGHGAIDRSTFGPFGILLLADHSLSELTPIYFNIANTTGDDPTLDPHFCADESRSSLAPDVQKFIYGSRIPVIDNEKLSMRVLVDHSIIESFGQGGRRVITSRVYPTQAIYGAAKLFLFNNATGVSVKASLKIWEMDSANIRPYPFEHV